MDARLNMLDNELAVSFSKRFANISLVIDRLGLPKATQESVRWYSSRSHSG